MRIGGNGGILGDVVKLKQKMVTMVEINSNCLYFLDSISLYFQNFSCMHWRKMTNPTFC